jgi:O-antigen biosynthesis protein
LDSISKKLRRSQPEIDRSLPPLEDTGERVIPERSDKGFARVNFVRHKVAHQYVIRKIRKARRVLDVGCGTGYGSAMVAARVGEVVGIDVSEEAVTWARAQTPYGQRGVRRYACYRAKLAF